MIFIFFFVFSSCSHLFTSDPRGVLKLWNVDTIFQSNADNSNMDHVFLVAVFTSSFGARIMCLDASLEDEVIG